MRNKLHARFQATGTTRMLVSNDLEEAVYVDERVLLLTRRPTHIAQIVPFPAPRQRHPDTLTSGEFVHAKAVCLEVFQREVRG
jgi:NitT/TauT family transport system ATP-binding protein